MGILKLGAAQNRLGLLALVLLEAYCVGVSSEAELVWTRTYGGEGSDFARRLVQDGGEGFIIAGWTESFDAGLRDIYLLKIEAMGNRVWERTYGGPTRDEALDIIHCRDGGFVIAGRTGWTEALGVRSEDAFLAKIDGEGNLIWNRTYGSNGTDSAKCVVESPDGGFVFAGVTTHSADPYLHSESGDVYVVKTDGEGNVIWNRTYGGGGSDWANCMVTSSDGYVIGGITWSFSTNSYDVYLLKIDHAGEKVWEKAYGGSGYDEASSIVRSGDGRLIVAGETRSFGAVFADVYLLEIDNDGNLLWQKTYGGPRDDYARCIIQSGDGGFIVVGATGDPNERQADVHVLKIDAEGNKVWERSFGGAENDRATCVVPSRDGGFVVVGTTSFLLPSPGFSEDILLMGIRVPPGPIPEFPETVLMLLCGLLIWSTIGVRGR